MNDPKVGVAEVTCPTFEAMGQIPVFHRTFFLFVEPFSGSHGKAARQRELAVLGYLGGIIDQSGVTKSLRSVVPYRVTWSNVALRVCHETIPKSQILYAFNGNFVALCIADDKQVMFLIIDV